MLRLLQILASRACRQNGISRVILRPNWQSIPAADRESSAVEGNVLPAAGSPKPLNGPQWNGWAAGAVERETVNPLHSLSFHVADLRTRKMSSSTSSHPKLFQIFSLTKL